MGDNVKISELWEIYTELDDSGKEVMTSMLEESTKEVPNQSEGIHE